MPKGVYERTGQNWVGPSNHQWKGNRAGYRAIHDWLTANFGKAVKCENRNCIYPRPIKRGSRQLMLRPRRHEWALLHGKKYQHRRENFIQLCPSCHKQYDAGSLKITL